MSSIKYTKIIYSNTILVFYIVYAKVLFWRQNLNKITKIMSLRHKHPCCVFAS